MDFGTRTLLLLGLSEGPAFGLELIARVKGRSRGRFQLNHCGVYVALRKLERDGLVRGWTRRTGATGRPRRYHELTGRGIAEASGLRDDLAHLVVPRESPIDTARARRMVDRLKRCGNVSLSARRLRDAGLEAGLR